MSNLHGYVFDAELELKDAGLITADAAALVDGVAKVLDLGQALWQGDLVVDATAIEVDSSNELFNICFQVSSSPTFASAVKTIAIIPLGAFEAIIGTDVDTPAGRYVIGVHNEHGGTIYRYARLYTDVTGTVGTGINYSAFLTQRT